MFFSQAEQIMSEYQLPNLRPEAFPGPAAGLTGTIPLPGLTLIIVVHSCSAVLSLMHGGFALL